MKVTDLREMYVIELQEARSVEEQLTRSLPKMAEKAHDERLKDALQAHLKETQSQLDRVDKLLRSDEAQVDGHRDQSMQALLGECEKWAGMIDDSSLRDAALISSAQRVEHYEMALYGSLAAWARQLGLDEDASVLFGILEEEKSADGKLTEVAKKSLHPSAA